MNARPLPPHRRIGRAVLIVGAVLASFIALLVWKGLDERDHAARLDEAQLGLRAWALAGNMDRALELTERDLADLGTLLAAAPDQRARLLRQRLLRAPHLSDLILYDIDGHALARGGFHPLPPSQASAPAWAGQSQAMATGNGLGLHGGQAAMSRALTTLGGAPVAMLVAVLNRDGLLTDMEQVSGQRRQAVALVDADGQVLMGRADGQDIAGRALPQVPDFADLSGDGFATRGIRFHHDGDGTTAVVQLRSHPFRLMITANELQAVWWRQTRTNLALGAGLVAAALVFLGFWVRAIRREQAAADRLGRLYQAIEQIPAAFVMTDSDANIQYVNPAFTGSTGYGVTDVVGKNPRLLQSGQTPGAVYDSLWDALGQGRPWRGELLNRRKDGSTYWEDSVIAPLRDDHGHITNFIAFKSDISSLKAAEAQLRELSERFQATFEQAAVGIGHMHLDGHWLRVNTRLCEILGYPRHELADLTYLDLTPEDDRDTSAQLLVDLLAGAIDVYDRDKQYIRKDGQKVWVRATVSLVRRPDGQPGYFLAVIQDISARKAVETELAQLSEKLLSSNENLQQFAYVASHDLQEPLRMVISYLQLMERRCAAQLGPEAREYMGFAIDGAQRMSRLIKDLLTYARVESKGHPFGPVAMDQVCATALGNLAITIEETAAHVAVESLPTVWGDEPQLVSLMQNLIGNALKYHAADRAPVINVTVRREANAWRFAVADNGIGIPPQYQDRIFAIFQRLHGRGDYDGTGIGLALCKKIVERHGGSIGVDSDGGNGSTFHFTLPVHT